MMLEQKKRVLVLHGGWEGHQPEQIANFAIDNLCSEFKVVRSADLGMLRSDILSGFDLLLPIWTFGELSNVQETDLLNAVADGLGVVAWHGNTSAFLNSRPHKFLLGGQFVAHPGGDNITYTVRFLDNDPLVRGLEDITVTSEQYYLLVDPAVKVLAVTSIKGDTMTWLSGVEMPQVWKRPWGKGRVFYSALGHTAEVLSHPSMVTLLRRAMHESARKSDSVIEHGAELDMTVPTDESLDAPTDFEPGRRAESRVI